MNVVSVLLSSQQQQESVDPLGTGGCVNTELPLYYCSTVVATYRSGGFVVKEGSMDLIKYCQLLLIVNESRPSAQLGTKPGWNVG